MKKKIIILLAAAITIVSIFGIMPAYAAGSAVVTFSGPTTVAPGQTYTYTYTLKVTKAAAANANIEVGGAFQKVSGGTGLFYDTIPENTTGTVSGTVKVKVKSSAAFGSVGTLFVNTDESTCSELKFDSSGKLTDQIITTVTGSSTIKVVPAPPGTPCVYSAGKDKMMITWNLVNGTSGYEVWRSTAPSSGYSKIASTTNLSYMDTGLTTGITYYYRIRSYYQNSESTIRGSLSSFCSAAPSSVSSELKPSISANVVFNKTWGSTFDITVGTKFDCDVSVRIANANGNTVKNVEYYQPYSAGMHTVYWDGTDLKGNLLPSGTYTIIAIERSHDGTIFYTKKALTLNIIKTPQITSNSKYPKTSNNKHLIKFSITQDTKVSIVIRDAAGKSIRYIANKSDFNAGQHNVYWDGKDSKGNVVPSGLYYIYGIQYDEDGKYTYTKKKLAVEISEKPTITSNSYYTRTGTNRHLIKVDIATPALVSTVIKDGNLKSVIYLEYKASHQDGKIYLYWDGKDKSGNDMPDGIYYIYAIQYKDDGSYVYTRKKLVLN